ncbi:MAG: hypothetical protein ABEN55_07420 [Bradymonadaceae bacterium]
MAALLVAGTLAVAPSKGAAAEPAGEAASPTQTESVATSTSGESNGYWWFYISVLGLAAMVPLGLFVYRRFRVDEEYALDEPSMDLEGGAGSEPARTDGGAGESSLGRAEQSFFSVAEMALGQSGEAERMCPECGETFPATVVMCPYDSTPLDKIDQGASLQAGDDTVLDRKACPGCGRRYEPGPEFCYHDGMRLRQDTAEDADEAPVFWVCETCGWEGAEDRQLCPRDGQELTVVDPSEEMKASPPVPVLLCPECNSYVEPGHARCPDDDAVLTPLHNTHTTELPGRGFGPRRKMCQECGETYSSAAQYCTKDGAELMPMN